MPLPDNGWTENQAQGLFERLNLDGGTPKWKWEPSTGCDPGAPRTEKMRPQSMGNLSSSPLTFAILTKG